MNWEKRKGRRKLGEVVTIIKRVAFVTKNNNKFFNTVDDDYSDSAGDDVHDGDMNNKLT